MSLSLAMTCQIGVQPAHPSPQHPKPWKASLKWVGQARSSDSAKCLEGRAILNGTSSDLSFAPPRISRPNAAPAASAPKEACRLLDRQRMGMFGSWGDKSFTDPRICDVPDHVLSRRSPARYPFDLGAPLKQRERQRMECINTWRAQNHLPALQLPPPKRED